MKYEDNHKIGKLVAVEDHGTTVSIWVDHDEPIPIDWRMFNAIVECEGPDLIGRSVDYNIEDGSIAFLEKGIYKSTRHSFGSSRTINIEAENGNDWNLHTDFEELPNITKGLKKGQKVLVERRYPNETFKLYER